MGAHHEQRPVALLESQDCRVLGGLGCTSCRPLTLLQLSLLSSTIYLSFQPFSQPGGHPWCSRKQTGVRESSTSHSLDSPLQRPPLLAPPVVAVLLASACLPRPGGQGVGSEQDGAPRAGQLPGTHAWPHATPAPTGEFGHLWDRPQRMPPIATCLPVLGKRAGKKERSSPRQALPGAVVSECGHRGGAGLAGEGKGQEVVVVV